jgi:hypothetical protein
LEKVTLSLTLRCFKADFRLSAVSDAWLTSWAGTVVWAAAVGASAASGIGLGLWLGLWLGVL